MKQGVLFATCISASGKALKKNADILIEVYNNGDSISDKR